MIQPQIQRLKQDSLELDHYAKRLKKQGKTEKMHKILQKREWLDNEILEVIDTINRRH